MRAILFSLLSHKPDIWNTADGGRIECAMFFTILNDCLIDRCITAIGYHGFCIMKLSVRSPHLAGIANDNWHGCIDNNIIRYMQVGNPLV